MRLTRHAVLFVVLGVVAGCSGIKRNYVDRVAPRYSETAVARTSAHAGVDTLRIVSFNIKFAQQIDSTIAVLTTDPAMRDADIVLLQEMDEPGTKRIAEALGMSYVYYPAVLRSNTHRDFGNAVLTHWAIVEDAKIILPHNALFNGSQRIATATTVRVGDTPIRVYSAHLATFVNIWPGSRGDQLRAILADADKHPRVIIGGDMNNHSVGHIARDRGYIWTTEHGPRTTPLGRWDHIFLKGLALPDSAASGTVTNVHHASDHKAVWARAIRTP